MNSNISILHLCCFSFMYINMFVEMFGFIMGLLFNCLDTLIMIGKGHALW